MLPLLNPAVADPTLLPAEAGGAPAPTSEPATGPVAVPFAT